MSSKFRLPMEKQIADREMHPRTPRIFFPPSNAMRGGPACPDAVMPPRSHSKAPTTTTPPRPAKKSKATGGELREPRVPCHALAATESELHLHGKFRPWPDTAGRGRFLSRGEWRLALVLLLLSVPCFLSLFPPSVVSLLPFTSK